mgnify:FL=1
MPNPLIASIMREIMTASRMRDHAEVMRTIKGPCFDCDVRSCWCGWGDNDECACHSPMGERTAPIIKIEPDELRPNVPPRMW